MLVLSVILTALSGVAVVTLEVVPGMHSLVDGGTLERFSAPMIGLWLLCFVAWACCAFCCGHGWTTWCGVALPVVLVNLCLAATLCHIHLLTTINMHVKGSGVSRNPGTLDPHSSSDRFDATLPDR